MGIFFSEDGGYGFNNINKIVGTSWDNPVHLSISGQFWDYRTFANFVYDY